MCMTAPLHLTVVWDVGKRPSPDSLAEAVDALEHRQMQILNARYGLNGGGHQTWECVGRQFGISRERCRQIHRSAVTRLKKLVPEDQLLRLIAPHAHCKLAELPGRLADKSRIANEAPPLIVLAIEVLFLDWNENRPLRVTRSSE
jgi:hypothetical protein